MEKLLEQAQTLVADLNSAKAEVANQKAVLDKQANAQAIVQNTLDNFQSELLDRESDIRPIENAQEVINNADRIKAEADLQASKVAGEWGALKTAKDNFNIEREAGRKNIAEKKALYDRGAEENKTTRYKLEEKLKKLKEVTV